MKRERPTQKRIDDLEAEAETLRDVLIDLLFLKKAREAGETWASQERREREAWQAARDLVEGEG